ncbi:hypothetical protein ACPX19_09875 [Winogradskyella sp. HB-48]|uniref:hypothetical protein n=1 Tax=Winogradskyella sp. HB-48 TaxID=3416808 RepID=UPI003CEC1AF2
MTETTNTPKKIINTLTVIHYGYCIAILVFATVVFLISDHTIISFDDSEDLFLYLVPIFAFGGVSVSIFMFKAQLKQIHKKETLIEKLTAYQTSHLIRIALIEGPAFLGIVIFMISSNLFYLIIALALLVYLIFLRPTANGIKEDLNLNFEQEKEFRKNIQ